jgi:hypothetical protein
VSVIFKIKANDMIKSILDSPSFWALDEAARAAVRSYVDPEGIRPVLDTCAIYKQRWSLATALVDAEKRLNQVNPALFPFLSVDQKRALEGELFLAFYQLSAQYKLDWVEREWAKLPDRGQQLKDCADLINQLRTAHQRSPEAQLIYARSPSQGHTKYLGLRLITPVLLQSMDAIISGKIAPLKSLVEGIGIANERRLYWVWGGSMIRVLLDLLPKSFTNTSTATHILDAISPITGQMSYLFYFTRAGIEWGGLISHTFDFAMGREERALALTRKERWTTQWEMRKYMLLNDTIWGVCNAACFFVLVGSGMLGFYGNVFTAVLLAMDLMLTAWRQEEEKVAHHANMERYRRHMEALEEQIKAMGGLTPGALEGVSIDRLRDALREVKQQAFQAQLDWKYKQYGTSLDLWYAASLLAAFAVLCCLSFPGFGILPAAGLLFIVVGTCLCFTFNLIYSSINMGLSVSKTSELKQLVDDNLQQQLGFFMASAQMINHLPTGEKGAHLELQLKQKYLTLHALRAESRHHQDVIRHQRYQLITSTLRDVLIPVVFITSIVFLPLGASIPVIAVGLILAVALYCFISKMDPLKKKQHLPDFDEHAYTVFRTKALTAEPAELLRLLGPEPQKGLQLTSFFSSKTDEKLTPKAPVSSLKLST